MQIQEEDCVVDFSRLVNHIVAHSAPVRNGGHILLWGRSILEEGPVAAERDWVHRCKNSFERHCWLHQSFVVRRSDLIYEVHRRIYDSRDIRLANFAAWCRIFESSVQKTHREGVTLREPPLNLGVNLRTRHRIKLRYAFKIHIFPILHRILSGG